MREPLSKHRFYKGAAVSLPDLLDEALIDSYAMGSRNQILTGLGTARPWKGLESKGAGTGSRQMLQVGSTWGGIKDYASVQGAGSFFEDIGRSRWMIGGGKPSVQGVDMLGITLSTILQVSIAVGGNYDPATTFDAGMPQPSTPDVAILDTPGAGYIGIINGPVSFKIARLRLTTGARSIASLTSQVLVPANKSIRITFPLPSAGQTHWRAFSTQEGFGGVGLHYALRYGIGSAAVLDIPESVVAAGTAGGIARSLEFDYHTGDLVPEIAYIDDYPPPAGTHAVRLENVMVVLGAFVDSTSSVTTTNPGTVGACSLPNFYESYKPSHRVYFPEQIVGHRARAQDNYCYVAHRNSISALQYIGLRDGPAVALVVISPDLGVPSTHAWTQVQGQIYMMAAKGGPARMRPDGSWDYSFAAKVLKAMESWDPAQTVVAWHPDSLGVTYSYRSESWHFSLVTEDWSPICYFADAGISGTILSAVNSQGELIVTINDGGAHTAYTWDKGATKMPITSLTPYTGAKGGYTARIRELGITFECDNATNPAIISIHRNVRPTFVHDARSTNGSNRIDSDDADIDANHVIDGAMIYIEGTGIGGPGVDYVIGRISSIGASASASPSPSSSLSRSPSLSPSSSVSLSPSASVSRSPSSSVSRSISRSPSAS